MPIFFHCLSASTCTDRLFLVLAAVWPLWTLGHHWSKAQEVWSIISWASSVQCHRVPRWKVMPQGHSLSPHRTRISRANLSLSLTALCFIFCSQYPALYYLHHQWHELYPASSSLHRQGEGTILRVGSQTGDCRSPWAAAGMRAPSAGHVTPLQMLLRLVAQPVIPTKPTTWE